MNCKPGDLALVVEATHRERIGSIVKVLKPTMLTTYWVVEWRGGLYIAHDSWLKPLRGDSGEDETLRWAGKPQEVTA